MGAIPYNALVHISSAINDVRDKMCALTPMPELTHDDFLNLFVEPKDQRVLKEAARLAHVDRKAVNFVSAIEHPRFEEALGAPMVDVMFELYGDDAPLSPKNNVPLKGAPQHVLGAIAEWAISMVEINIQSSRTHALVHWLNENCANAAQVRFLWPSIVALANMREDTKGFANKLRDVPAPKSLPAIPAEVRTACRLTAGFVASASLIAPDPEDDKFYPVEILLPSNIYHRTNTIRRKEGVLGMLRGYP